MSRVIIVGGGPAGLATAIAARRLGVEVTVIERQQPPIDKACGEGLMPAGVSALRELGVVIDPAVCWPFDGIALVCADAGASIVAATRFLHGYGLGIRRVVLHRMLSDVAADMGAELRWGSVAEAMGDRQLRVDGRWERADWVVGADGLHSRVRRWAGLSGKATGVRRFGIRRHYRMVPWRNQVEVHWGDGADAYVTPIAADVVGVALLSAGQAPDFDQLLACFPSLAERLQGAELITDQRGAGPFRQRVKAVARDGVALVGDASGYVDPLTGEGLALAFRQALSLAQAIAAGDLDLYRRDHRRIVRMPTMFTQAALLAHAHPWLQRLTLRALRAHPRTFATLLRFAA